MLDIVRVGCMGVFTQDVLCTIADHLGEQSTLLDISTNAIKEAFGKAFGLQ